MDRNGTEEALDTQIDGLQSAIINAGGKLFTRKYLKEITVFHLLQSLIPNGLVLEVTKPEKED